LFSLGNLEMSAAGSDGIDALMLTSQPGKYDLSTSFVISVHDLCRKVYAVFLETCSIQRSINLDLDLEMEVKLLLFVYEYVFMLGCSSVK
jgi:hypothetical protein